MNYTYSVSIPHYNSVDSLANMLDSIPERDDIQVIVVDDGSKPEAVEKLKRLKHKNLELILQNENHGGGYARNVGLSKAIGQWFISVDSDDFFSDDAFNILDEQIKGGYDVIVFCITAMSEDRIPSGYQPKANQSVLDYLKKPSKHNENLIRYYNLETWNKLVSMDFIRKNNICYENCRINIDVYYSLQIGLKAQRIMVIPNSLYNWVMTTGSITQQKRSIEREFQFYLQVQKRNGFYKKMGLTYLPFYRSDILYIPFMIKKRGFKETFQFFKLRKQKIEEVKKARLQYISLLNK